MIRQVCLAIIITIAAARAELPGLVITGDPASDSGARWTYSDTTNDTVFDLAGVLFRPAGGDTLPGIILSHGRGGSANGIGSNLARTMRYWGLACIATNYTHAGGVPIGSPGDSTMPGASFANIQRAMTCWRILSSLGWVDTNRVAAHGHSMGAFLTGGLAGTHPRHLKVASHTAGGVNDAGVAWTKSWQAESITCPYQMHHGDSDPVVPLRDDQRFDSILTARAVTHELVVHPGRNHNIASDTGVLRRVRDWYTEYGLFDSGQVAAEEPGRQPATPLSPAVATLARGALRSPVSPLSIHNSLFDITGRAVMALGPGANDISRLGAGVYFVAERTAMGEERVANKVIVLP